MNKVPVKHWPISSRSMSTYWWAKKSQTSSIVHVSQAKSEELSSGIHLRIINCRELGLMDVVLYDWSFIAKRGLEVVYSWEYTRIPRTHSSAAGAILARMFKWHVEKSDAGKKAFFNNLKTNRQFRMVELVWSLHAPPHVDVDRISSDQCDYHQRNKPFQCYWTWLNHIQPRNGTLSRSEELRFSMIGNIQGFPGHMAIVQAQS